MSVASMGAAEARDALPDRRELIREFSDFVDPDTRAIVRDFGPTWLFRTMAVCKLYDWDRGQWLGFDGRPRPAVR